MDPAREPDRFLRGLYQAIRFRLEAGRSARGQRAIESELMDLAGVIRGLEEFRDHPTYGEIEQLEQSLVREYQAAA